MQVKFDFSHSNEGTDTKLKIYVDLFPQGNHIVIDREDRRSQLRTFKEGISWLKKGVPLMAFPEGRRSDDGRLMDFKGGIFSMATKAGVPIVPISISNTHAIMPPNSLMPFQSGAGKLHIHFHPEIDVEGKSEDELSVLVKDALLSKMPLDQHPRADEDQEKVGVEHDLQEKVNAVVVDIKKASEDNVKPNLEKVQ